MQQKNRQTSVIEPWIPIKTSFRESLPSSGEGVVSANIIRRTTFAIRICPKKKVQIKEHSESDDTDEEGYVEVEISAKKMTLLQKKCSLEHF